MADRARQSVYRLLTVGISFATLSAAAATDSQSEYIALFTTVGYYHTLSFSLSRYSGFTIITWLSLFYNQQRRTLYSLSQESIMSAFGIGCNP